MVNSKHAFWQALIVTVAVFIIGLFIGIAIEGQRADYAQERFTQSELSLMDTFALNELSKLSEEGLLSCETLLNANIEFADKIYSEALLFEKQGESEKLTDSLDVVLKRYDILRTLLWINTMNIPEECMEDTSIVVYLFDRNAEDLETRSANQVWEKILSDLKQETGNEVILIPISVSSDLTSLNSLLDEFNVSEFPSVIINNNVISEIKSVEELRTYLN